MKVDIFIQLTLIYTFFSFSNPLSEINIDLSQAGATGAAMSGLVAGEGGQRTTGIPVLHAGSHFRHGLLQLMIHTIDPLHDGEHKSEFFHFSPHLLRKFID